MLLFENNSFQYYKKEIFIPFVENKISQEPDRNYNPTLKRAFISKVETKLATYEPYEVLSQMVDRINKLCADHWDSLNENQKKDPLDDRFKLILSDDEELKKVSEQLYSRIQGYLYFGPSFKSCCNVF